MSFRFQRTGRKKPRIDIVPMVDVMTFLIVFFMLFTTFRTNPAGLDIRLPRAETATAQQASTTVITIDKAGNVYLGDKRTSLDSLKAVSYTHLLWECLSHTSLMRLGWGSLQQS